MRTQQDVEQMLRVSMDRGEEGLVFKDLSSLWEKGDRSSSWMKMKPDYLATEDLARRLRVTLRDDASVC